MLVVGGLPISLLNFRGSLLRSMIELGYRVSACAGGTESDVVSGLQAMGVAYHPIKLARGGMNPVTDMATFLKLWRLMGRLRPDVVLAYTIKPVIYAGLSARLRRIGRFFAMIEGLGFAFMEPASLRERLAGFVGRKLYRLSLPGYRKVFFLNPDDMSLFLTRRLVKREQAIHIPGIGVDLRHYSPTPLPDDPVFLLIARMLVEKGIREYAQAARIVRQTHPRARFLLVGPLDSNPSAVSLEEIESWVQEKAIEYMGELRDVRPVISQARVYVLPSYYREGLPRTLLEAMSMGRPVITTDNTGCRETVQRLPEAERPVIDCPRIAVGRNGLLVPPRDPGTLAIAMEYLLRHPELAAVMGREGRRLAAEHFDVHKINTLLLAEMGLR